MENRGSKAMAIAALVVGVVGLTIGFAAFTSTLTINSTATVTGTKDEFMGKVTVDASSFDCTGSAQVTQVSDTTISVSATLANPGDKATCTGTVTNGSPYTAYLNGVTGFGITSVLPEGTLKPATDAYLSNITEEDMKVTIIDGEEASGTKYTTDNSTISGSTIEAGDSKTLVVVIEYVEGADVADGDFKTTFNPITLTYGTAE